MSYLSAVEGPTDCSKAVISLWFRVPTKTMDSIRTEFTTWQTAGSDLKTRGRFLGIVPLITFGPSNLRARKFYFPHRGVGIGTYENQDWSDGSGFPVCAGAGWRTLSSTTSALTAGYYSFEQGNDTSGGAGGDFVLDGSYIGVDCTGDFPALSVSLVMPENNKASFEGAWPVLKTEEHSGPNIFYSGGGLCPGAPHMYADPIYGLCFTTTFSTFTATNTFEGSGEVVAGCVPETFRLLPARRAGAAEMDDTNENFTAALITPDHWHHLLLSFDILEKVVKTAGQLMEDGSSPKPGEEGKRTTGTIKMWVALDDVNLTKTKLSAYWPNGYDDDPNGLLSVNGMWVAKQSNFSFTRSGNLAAACKGIGATTIQIQQTPKYSFTPSKLSLAPLGLPADADRDYAVRRVELADLQVFTAVALDTGVLTNRRAFISKDGKPVNPDQKDGSIDLMKKKPEILLRGSSDWKDGKNTGTVGSFVPTARIEKYKPNPKLGA